jgi:YHS domain-containing protein
MQPNRLPFALGLFLISSILALFGCSNGSSDSDANSTNSDANQTSSAIAPYPLDFCLVSGNNFDEDSEMIPYVYVHEGTTIKFCCKPCLPKFKKNTDKYLADLKEEIDALAQEPKG